MVSTSTVPRIRRTSSFPPSAIARRSRSRRSRPWADTIQYITPKVPAVSMPSRGPGRRSWRPSWREAMNFAEQLLTSQLKFVDEVAVPAPCCSTPG